MRAASNDDVIFLVSSRFRGFCFVLLCAFTLLSNILSPLFYFEQGIQDLLICLEMLVAAVFFFYAFPLSDYLKNPQDQSHPPKHPEQQNAGFHHHAEDDSGGEGPIVGSNVSTSQKHVHAWL